MKRKNFIKLLIGFSLISTTACTRTQFEQLDKPSRDNLLIFKKSLDQQTQERRVDILVVVDNSRSMKADQEKLAREFSNFVSGVVDSDYRIGVITTDTDSVGFENTPGYWGNLDTIPQTGKNYISKLDNNPEEFFSSIINRQETAECTSAQDSVCASFDEKPLYAIKMAIEKRDDKNSGFFREDADLVVLIITDEDETADENGFAYSALELLSFIEKEFKGSKKVLGFSIAIQDQDEDCFNEQGKDVFNLSSVAFGIRVGELADLTGGFKVSICNPNFGQDLLAISDYIQQELLQFRHKLPETVDLSTIEVSVTLPDGRPFKVETEILEQELRINPNPPAGSRIDVRYGY